MIKRILAWFGGISALIMVPFSFYMSAMFQQTFYNLLPLRVDPRLSGGSVAAVFSDPYQDDHGPGSISYPEHESFTAGSLDILEYQVYYPMEDAPWSSQNHLWQIAWVVASLEEVAKAPVFRIYIDIDGAESGRSTTLEENQENVSLDVRYPWDYCVTAIVGKGIVLLKDSEGNLLEQLSLFEDSKGQRYIVQLPLKYGLERVLDGRTTRHCLISGFYDDISVFMPIRRMASQRSPGGASSVNYPAVVDYLAPASLSQEELLSSALREIHYVEVQGETPEQAQYRRWHEGLSVKGETYEKEHSDEGLSTEQSQAEEEQRIALLEEELASVEIDDLRKGELLFQLNRLDESQQIFQYLWEQDQNVWALIYMGTLKAMEAGQESPMAAIALVEESYALYEEAEALIADDSELMIHLLIHRGNVSMSVPNSVFAMAQSGAEDFLAAAELMERTGGNSDDISNLYFQAARCYDIAGLADQARITRLKVQN